MKRFLMTLPCVILMLSSCVKQTNVEETTFDVNSQLDYCHQQVEKALTALQPYDFTMMPRNILEGETTWNCRKAAAEEWCSGFWPGILWMTYAAQVQSSKFLKDQASKLERKVQSEQLDSLRKIAEGYTDALRFLAERPAFDHDLGFITINSFMKGYEATGNEEYKRIALACADTLATLYNSKVGTILSWPRHVKDYGGHNTIMDNMINLELLLWASLTPDPSPKGEGRKKLYDIAVRHAETTMEHHFREDGSSYHVAVYDTLDGHFIKGVTHQGYSDESMWSRGQSWAIYGYTMVYRYTRDQRFLDFAQKVTDIYLKRLQETSDDWVPQWDMDAPTPAPKDASAACVVASALLELCQYDVAGERKDVNGKSVNARYYDAAIAMLRDLSTDRYQSRDKNTAFLLHSTGHHPAGSEIDASIIYADYYYLEALLRLKQF